MKANIFRNLFLLMISLSCFWTLSAAQQNDTSVKPGDFRKIMEQQKKEIENDQDMDPGDKARLLKMMNSKKMKDAAKMMDHPDSKMKAAFRLGEKMTSLPLPDKKRLASIPAKTFTKTQLTQYVHELSAKLNATVSIQSKSNANKIMLNTKSSASLDAASLVAWYNGHPEEALLLSVKSVNLSYDVNALNNLGAMLNLSGHEEKAVPLLQYALLHDSANASVLNNLGRAWLGLGEKKKAMQMFINCVHYAPDHPEANNSLGCLYEAQGDTKDAVSSFEKSLAGAYNQNADEHLSKLEPDYDLPKLIKFHYKAPKYFDQWKIEIPSECTEILQQDSISKIHDAFQSGLGNLMNEYAAMGQQAHDELMKEEKELQSSLINALDKEQGSRMNIAPFELIAHKMLAELAGDYLIDKTKAIRDYQEKYQQLIANYESAGKAMDDKLKEAVSKLVFEGEGGRNDEAEWERLTKANCEAQKKLSDKTQFKAGQLHADFKTKYHRIALDYFDNRVYWAGMTSTLPAVVNVETYNAITDFIYELNYLSSTTPFVNGHLCDLHPSDGKRLPPETFGATQKPDCPLSVNIAFLIGKINFDCTSFSISGGEGVKLGYKKDFSNGQSTLSVGAGLTAQVGTGNINAGVSADESIYITFNGDGQPCDAGLKAGVSAGINAGAVSSSADAGYTVSMNSGFNFTHSALSNSINL